MIKQGQRVTIKKQWRDRPEIEITYIALEDSGCGTSETPDRERVRIMADLGWPINPCETVLVSMLELVE